MCPANEIIFSCCFCDYTCFSLRDHLSHRFIHRHINNSRYFCGVNHCSKLFCRESLLRIHILRSHQIKVSQLRSTRLPPSAPRGKYICSVAVCKKEFDVYKQFLSHLYFHLSLNTAAVKCPYHECSKIYTNKKSLSAHLSRFHRSSSQSASENSSTPNGNEDFPDDFIPEDIPDNHYEDQESTTTTSKRNSEDLVLQNLAQFCMRLEYHHLIPEKVIQYVFEEMSQVYSNGLNFLSDEIKRQMEIEKISNEKIQRIVNYAFKNDPFIKTLSKDLRSEYKRKEFYKRTFPFVEPEKVDFFKTVKGPDGSQVKIPKFFYYVPIKETLQACFLDKSLKLKIEHVYTRTDGLLCDVTDGKLFLESKFFQENPLSLRIVIYQDGVEIVNPLGPGKKKHKVLAIYLSILNLPDYVRSHINSIKLVALCKEKDFDHKSVYGRIVEDLKDLERNGLNVDGFGIVKVGLVFIAGDNLGSHALGGFVENFSKATYFCRYCLLDRPTFFSEYGENVTFDIRTVESYGECLEHVKSKKSGYKGIKFDSVFNQLQHFHVCSPGLPCCLGHDLMEGIIAYDLKLYIDYFISESWFTLHELNEAIAGFNYSKEEMRDRPLPVEEDACKIKGGAWQIWTFLRLFPIIVQDYIEDDKDDVWQALIKLTEITEIVCAPAIHKSFLPYIQYITSDYLAVRKSLFPAHPLRPKHHYVTHYAWLTSMFGPLMKVWTMRFESKHTYFKRYARVIRCFKNILFSLSMKHELFQCYLRSGADLRCEIETAGTNKLMITTYSKSIQNAVSSLAVNYDDLEECSKVMVKGTAYRKGSVIVISQESYECEVQLGRISLLLFDCCEQIVYFVCEKLQSSYRPRQRLYVLGESEGFVCVRQDALKSFYPSTVHSVQSNQLVKLKHAIVHTSF